MTIAGGLAIIGLKECDYWNCLEGFLTSTKVERGWVAEKIQLY